MKSIVPEYITITLGDAFGSTKRSFEVFNDYIQSKDLGTLIEDMEPSSYLFELWKQSLEKALKESAEFKNE